MRCFVATIVVLIALNCIDAFHQSFKTKMRVPLHLSMHTELDASIEPKMNPREEVSKTQLVI